MVNITIELQRQHHSKLIAKFEKELNNYFYDQLARPLGKNLFGQIRLTLHNQLVNLLYND